MAQIAVRTHAPRRVTTHPTTVGAYGPGGRPASATSKPRQLQALTGLRAVAALLVVMFHFLTIHVAAGSGAWHAVTQLGANVVASGYTGVSFFFLLSGFILAYTYTDVRGGVRGTARAFWQARFARVYPVFALATILGLVLYAKAGVWHEQFCVGPRPSWTLTGVHPVIAAVVSFLMVQAWTPCAMTWNAPAWSLSVEAFFYLLFPLIALGVIRLGRRSLLAAIAVCWALIVATALAYNVFSLDASALHVAWWHRFWTWTLYANPVARLPEFVIGVALGRLFLTRGDARPWTGLLAPRRLSVLAAVGVAALWCVGPLGLIFYNQILIDPLYALLIYSIAFGEGPVAVLFAVPAAVLLGEGSYALYILHWPLMGWVRQVLPPVRVGVPGYVAPSTVYFLIYLCVVIAAALASYRFLERPARRAINGAFSRGRDGALDRVRARGLSAAGRE